GLSAKRLDPMVWRGGHAQWHSAEHGDGKWTVPVGSGRGEDGNPLRRERLGLGLLVPRSPDDRGHAAFVLRHPPCCVRRNPFRRAWALSKPPFSACNCFINTQR